MTDQELQQAEERLADMNARSLELGRMLDAAAAKIQEHASQVRALSLHRDTVAAQRKQLKTEYGELYERVGREKKAREKAAQEAPAA